MDNVVTIKHTDELYPQIVALRQLILRDPQKRKITADDLENDKRIIYFAYVIGGELHGVVGLEKISSKKGQLRQMAVHNKIQGKGVGRKLVESMQEHARKLGLQEIYLESRCTARGFYARLGYSEYGTVYDKNGLPHIHMRKALGFF